MSRYFHGECPEPKHAWLEAKLRAWVLKMGVELSGFTEAELRQVPVPRSRTILLKLCLMSCGSRSHNRRRFLGALGGRMPRLLPGTISPPGPGRR